MGTALKAFSVSVSPYLRKGEGRSFFLLHKMVFNKGAQALPVHQAPPRALQVATIVSTQLCSKAVSQGYFLPFTFLVQSQSHKQSK